MFRSVTRNRFDVGIRPALRQFFLLISAVVFISFPALAESPPLVDESFSENRLQAMKQTRAVIHTRFGEIQLRFFPEDAPNHVKNFLELARKGFYNGTTFHRVIPGFMIQGGDPLTRDADRSRHGTGGPDYRLKAEFSDRPHNRGTLSMARSAHPDSAGSQFFICVADAPHLDGQYTVFGEVTEGMDVVDKIAAEPRDRRDNPKERVEMRVEVISSENPEEPESSVPAPADSSDPE